MCILDKYGVFQGSGSRSLFSVFINRVLIVIMCWKGCADMLILPIKKQWYDLILSGEKKEEYREIKPYYRSRLKNEGFLDQYGLPDLWQDWVLFRNGYSKSSPSFEALCTVDIRTGRPEWGAEPGKEYYVLKILEIRNI